MNRHFYLLSQCVFFGLVKLTKKYNVLLTKNPLSWISPMISLSVIISVPECETLNSTWSKVVTNPTLPVQNGVEITLTCPADHLNKGGNKATCLNGQLVPSTTPPQCSFIGKCILVVTVITSYNLSKFNYFRL